MHSSPCFSYLYFTNGRPFYKWKYFITPSFPKERDPWTLSIKKENSFSLLPFQELLIRAEIKNSVADISNLCIRKGSQ